MVKISKTLNGSELIFTLEGPDAEVKGVWLSMYNWGQVNTELSETIVGGIVATSPEGYIKATATKIASETESNNLAKPYKKKPELFIKRNRMMAKARLNAIPCVSGVFSHSEVSYEYGMGQFD